MQAGLPGPSRSTILSTTKSWPGLKDIKLLVVLCVWKSLFHVLSPISTVMHSGDSFSSIGYSSSDPPPTSEQPLGIPFPGLTSCENVDETTDRVTYEPNWVGHFVQTVNNKRPGEAALRVRDYAVTGDTVARMRRWQVRREFLAHARAESEPTWSATDTLFVTWIGINDCSWNVRLKPPSVQPCFDDLFGAQEELYSAGARNFCLVDVPPVHIFPSGMLICRSGAYRY